MRKLETNKGSLPPPLPLALCRPTLLIQQHGRTIQSMLTILHSVAVSNLWSAYGSSTPGYGLISGVAWIDN